MSNCGKTGAVNPQHKCDLEDPRASFKDWWRCHTEHGFDFDLVSPQWLALDQSHLTVQWAFLLVWSCIQEAAEALVWAVFKGAQHLMRN